MKAVYVLLVMMAIVTACQSISSENSQTKPMQTNDIIKFVGNDDLEAVDEALRGGFNVNTTDSNRCSLLLLAVHNRQTDMARLLVKHGADVNQQASNQDSPFLYAGASGQTCLVKLFLENGARFDVFNRYNGSALIPACERGYVETVRVLVYTEGYPIDHVNRLGWTALMEAVILGDGSESYQQIVQILKDGGSKLDIPDKEGVTPLQHAQNRGFTQIANLLK